MHQTHEAIPMAGTYSNGLPLGRFYRYNGAGYDVNDPTDPGHPAYTGPNRRREQPRRPPQPVGLTYTERKAARAAADKAKR
jgi:hypothetical protein